MTEDNVTPGMWQMVSDLLDGEKLPASMNAALEKLCAGTMTVVPFDVPNRTAVDGISIPTKPFRVENGPGSTLCVVRYMVETPEGWLGAYDESAFAAYGEACAAAEREACAKVCEDAWEIDAAAAIRARKP
jgi:hypothetical protein